MYIHLQYFMRNIYRHQINHSTITIYSDLKQEMLSVQSKLKLKYSIYKKNHSTITID